MHSSHKAQSSNLFATRCGGQLESAAAVGAAAQLGSGDQRNMGLRDGAFGDLIWKSLDRFVEPILEMTKMSGFPTFNPRSYNSAAGINLHF